MFVSWNKTSHAKPNVIKGMYSNLTLENTSVALLYMDIKYRNEKLSILQHIKVVASLQSYSPLRW